MSNLRQKKVSSSTSSTIKRYKNKNEIHHKALISHIFEALWKEMGS